MKPEEGTGWLRLARGTVLAAALGAAGLAQAPGAKGWIEGTVPNPDGKPVWNLDRGASNLKLRVIGLSRGEATPQVEMGGLYSVRDLRPGVYEVHLESSKDGERKYRPVRIHGVQVKPGVRTMLNITVQEGDQLQEIGKPIATEQSVLVSQELARLAREMKQEMAKWKR